MVTFTAEQIAILGQNPYVLSVTEKRLTLTKEFRTQFWSDYNSGKKPGIIFAEHGFDVRMLRAERIREYSRRIRNEYAGLHAGKYVCKAHQENLAQKENTSDELKQLRNEVSYLRQEVDFLKKISSIRITRKSQEF